MARFKKNRKDYCSPIDHWYYRYGCRIGRRHKEWLNWEKDYLYEYGDTEDLGWLSVYDKSQDSDDWWWKPEDCDNRLDNAPYRFVKLPRDYR